MSNRNPGFTLLELMITVAIIGILAAVAYPMYIDKVRASKRVDARTALLRGANSEEQYYTTEHQYTASLSQLGLTRQTDNQAYTISASVSGGGDQKFTIRAQARGDQVNDRCATFTLNEIGAKTATDSSGKDVSARCW